MRYVIEAGEPFSQQSGSEEIDLYLTDHNRDQHEPAITRLLQLATLGAMGSARVEPEDGIKIREALKTEATTSPFPVPKNITPLVRYLLSKRFRGFIASYGGAYLGQLVDEGIHGPLTAVKKSELYKEYLWTADYANDLSRPTPTHLTSAGLVLQAPDVRSLRDPHLEDPYEFEAAHLYSQNVLRFDTHKEHWLYATTKDMMYVGQCVPLGINDEQAPVVAGPAVPTIGIRKDGHYVPKVIMHDPSPQEWEHL